MSPRALVIGEALIDEYADRRVVAGAPLHVAAHLTALGWDATLVTRVGDDPDGDWIRATAGNLGVDVSAIEVDPSLPTGRTSIRLEAGEPVFDVGRPAAWDSLAGPDVLPEHDILCFGSLPLRHRRSAAAIERMLAASDRPVIVDMNLRPPHYSEWSIEFAIASADILKLNKEELRKVAETLGTRPSPEALGPPWVCVTKGAEGADLHRSDGTGWSAKALPTRVVDSVGAGDAFLAGLIDGLIRAADPYVALETAIRLATDTLRHRGGLPATGTNP